MRDSGLSQALCRADFRDKIIRGCSVGQGNFLARAAGGQWIAHAGERKDPRDVSDGDLTRRPGFGQVVGPRIVVDDFSGICHYFARCLGLWALFIWGLKHAVSEARVHLVSGQKTRKRMASGSVGKPLNLNALEELSGCLTEWKRLDTSL